MTRLDLTSLEAALDALPIHTVIGVTTQHGELHILQRVPGGWFPLSYNDLVIASGDIADGHPTEVVIYDEVDVGLSQRVVISGCWNVNS